MKSLKKMGAAAAAVVFCCLTAAAFAAGAGPNVRIGIREGQGAVSVMSPQGVGVYRNGSLWTKYGANVPVRISLDGTAVAVNGTPGAGPITVRPLTTNGSVKITDGYAYRGAMEFIKSPTQWGITAINVVPTEQYLYGVVGKEMSPSWSLEALKAQAVAARTYAVSHKNYYQKRGFDMLDDTHSQTYAGINGEAPSVRQAVDVTNGEILTYGGKPIDAFFSATAGGWTENSENVWGNKIPYLRGVADPSDQMPAYRWAVTVSPERLASNLAAAGKGVGTVHSITLSPLAKRPMRVADRGVSGRVLSLTVNGSGGSVKITGNSFQDIFDLRSTLFDFYQGGGTPPDPDRGAVSRGATFAVKAGMPITIYGFGWGHGLGMSQYGAYQMAKTHGTDAAYYRTILSHYYSNTKLEQLY